MSYCLKQAQIFENGKFITKDAFIDVQEKSGGSNLNPKPISDVAGRAIINNCVLLPGLIDVHVHLREPGFSYKETIKTGTQAAARGGYSAVCSMPNLNPAPDSVKNLQLQLDIIEKDAVIDVYPYGCITEGERGEHLADMDGISAGVIGFSDDGRGVQSGEMMLAAMKKAAKLGKIIAAHCEDNLLLEGGYIHKGKYAALHNHKGISSESEYMPIKRDLLLAEKTGCRYHICHVSTKESVEAIRQAKKRGVDVTCETAPHYLILNDMDLREAGNFKMNPPIRDEEDRQALLEGIADGTIDMIATDHAPHSYEEKSKGLSDSLMGIVGIETAFSLLYTHLVRKKIISLEKLVSLMSLNPAKRFGIKNSGVVAFELEKQYTIDTADFLSKGRSTPFEGESVYGVCRLNVVNGKTIYENI